MRILIGSLILLTGCLFPSDVDPCPMPPEQHPEAWQRIDVKTADGWLVGYAYVCGGQT